MLIKQFVNIELAKKEGGQIHTPNGLPIACIKVDGTMLEHEHGDHKDYKFPVTAEFIGEKPADLPEWDNSYEHETHALIYADGNIAVTLYEYCYAMWRLSTGELMGSPKFSGWRLTKESIDKIVSYAPSSN